MVSLRDPRVRRRTSRTLIAALAATTLAACHGKPKTETPIAAAPVDMRTFGDTATFGVQVLSFDRQKEVAKVSLRAPAELIVLAVIPGREIELIVPSDLSKSSHASFKKGASDINMSRWDDSPRPASASDDAQRFREYNRCMQNAQATARRMAQAKRPVKRDSTGKVIEGSESGGTDLDQLTQLERQCDRLDANMSNRTPPPVRMPPRTPADRYLVVLASSTPLTAIQLGERLGALTAVGSDVATTIEAIAAGLYAGLPGTWSGGYVAW